MKKIINRFQLDVRIWIGLVGVSVVCIALLSILGYVFGQQRFYSWNGGIGMAVNTAVEFVLVGLGFIWISLSERVWK